MNLGAVIACVGGALAELEAANFASGGAGQFGDEFKFPGPLVRRKASNDEIEESGGQRGITGKPRVKDDPGDGLGQAVLVLLRDNRDLLDRLAK